MGNKMNKVLPGLYIGSARDAHDVEELMKNKISHILSVHENSKPDLPDKEYMCLPLADSPSQNIAYYFAQCNVFIHKARRTGNVLVHCQMGVSRSATIVVAYIMTVTRLAWKDALAALKAVRPFINPNFGFQQQLMVYEQKYIEEERTRLKTLFPLSQFNDIMHCEQLLETYRLSRLRNEQPMEVDVYPLALNAYGTKDFASLRLESTPANVVFCGPVSNPVSEEDCLVQRLGHVRLSETFASLDMLSCGCRNTLNVFRRPETQNVDVLATRLPNVQETRSTESDKNSVSGNVFRPSLLSSVTHEARSDDPKSTNAAAFESLFSNSVNISKSPTNNVPLSSVMEESRSQKTKSTEREKVSGTALPSGSLDDTVNYSRSNEAKSTNDETFESLFSNSVNISKKSAATNGLLSSMTQESRSQETKSAEREKNFLNGVTLLSGSLNNTMKNSRSDETKSPDDEALESLFSDSVGISKIPAGNNPMKNVARESWSQDSEPLKSTVVDSLFSNSVGGSENSTKNQRSSKAKAALAKVQVSSRPTEKDVRDIGRAYLRKHVNIWHDLSETDDDAEEKLPTVKTSSNSSSQMKITSNDLTQLKIVSNDLTQMKVTNNDPTQGRIIGNNSFQVKTTSKDPSQIRIVGKNSSQMKIMSNDPTQLKISSNDAQIMILGNNPFQLKITNNDPTQLKITSNDPTQLKIASNDPIQNRIVGSNPSQTKIMSNDPTQKRLSVSSKEEEITLLPSKSQLDQFFQG